MKLYSIIIIATFAFAFAGCGQADVKPADPPTASDTADTSETANNIASPTEALNSFTEAVRAKNEQGMHRALSKKTVAGFEKMAKESGKSFYDAVAGDDEEDMKKTMQTRNEKIDGDNATLEVLNTKNGKWDEIKFVKEEGEWKIALFDDAAGEM